MEKQTVNLMLALIRVAVFNVPLTVDEKAMCTEDVLNDLISLSDKHDVSHLVAHGLSQSGIFPEGTGLEKKVFTAVYRSESQRYELGRICEVLEVGRIPFVPLKGAVLREYYPEHWMRTSCDIDILVKPCDLDRATGLLIEQLGYTRGAETAHDVSLYSSNGVHIELHFELVEEGRAKSSSDILADAWSSVKPREGYSYFHEMSDEFFYFYHIAHMAKHFEVGGCGLRPFIDLYILDRLSTADAVARHNMLDAGGLLSFAKAASRLSNSWFCGDEKDELLSRFEGFVLRGGVYGSTENFVVVQRQRRGGRIRYVLSRIFPPYTELKQQYPVLEDRPWLVPFIHIRRWSRIVFRGRTGRAIAELRHGGAVTESEVESVDWLLRGLGL